ncbi:unnamed protein product, partial [Prorocentrum cordatum]
MRSAGLGPFSASRGPRWAQRPSKNDSGCKAGPRERVRTSEGPRIGKFRTSHAWACFPLSKAPDPLSRGMPLRQPKKSLGQNYLTDPNTIRLHIVAEFLDAAAAKGTPAAAVLELAPGLGALTRPLWERLPGMRAVELDDRAVEVLRRDLPGLEVIHADMLTLDLAAMSAQCGASLHVVGNLPYNIVSDVLVMLASSSGSVRSAQVMVQKEVADRVLAQPGSPSYGWLAPVVQLYTRPRLCFQVPPTAFYPRPKVTSAILELDFKEPAELPAVDFARVHELIRAAFQGRGKKLKGSLRALMATSRAALPREWENRRAVGARPAVNRTRSAPALRSTGWSSTSATCNDTLLAASQALGVTLSAWGSLSGPTTGRNPGASLSDPRLQSIAKRCSVSTAKLALRWLASEGVLPVTTTCSRQHAVDDLANASFELSAE